MRVLQTSVSTQFDGNWHQVAATNDGTTRKIYFDGVVRGSDTPTANSHAVPSNTAFKLGVTNGAEYYTGILDSVGIYSVARSPRRSWPPCGERGSTGRQ